MLDCGQLIMATEVIIALMRNGDLPQVILNADGLLVEMTVKNFRLDWEVVRLGDGFTVVARPRER